MKCHHVVNLFAANRRREIRHPASAKTTSPRTPPPAQRLAHDGFMQMGGDLVEVQVFCGQIFAIFFETLRQNATGTTGYISCFFVLYNAFFLLNVCQISK